MQKSEYLLLLLLFLCLQGVKAQEGDSPARLLSGKIVDEANFSLPGVNVYLEHDIQTGTTTNIDGKFELLIPAATPAQAILVISFVGFEARRLSLQDIDAEELKIVLRPAHSQLGEVVVKGNIAEEFSVTRLDKMDIYLNPNAAGDPLKAITTLPSSTNVNESASPELRGSSAGRSRVVINGIPVYKPTRNTQLNGTGIFSLFNPEIIDKQLVYASNPPLVYGSTSAGLVEIETTQKLENNELQLSGSLGSVGLLLSRRLHAQKQENFVQLYSNFQFSPAFLELNKKSFDFINYYSTYDAGINFSYRLSDRSKINLYNYNIYEEYNGESEAFSYSGPINSSNIRTFSLLNYIYERGSSSISFNNGLDLSRPKFSFGNIETDNPTAFLYSSLNYKKSLPGNISYKSGLTFDRGSYRLNDITSLYYYAIEPDAPTFLRDTTLINNSLELYTYSNWEPAGNIIVGAGVRTNVPLGGQAHYVSFQGNIRLGLDEHHSVLLAAGRYHNYNYPTFLNENFDLLRSDQLSIDYNYEKGERRLSLAAYLKKESGNVNYNFVEKADARNIFGAEFSIEQRFLRYFTFSVANTFLHIEMEDNDHSFKAYNSLNYFLKSSLQFLNPKYVNASISFISRPGLFYTGMESATFNPDLDLFAPELSTNINQQQYDGYNTLNLTLNRNMRVGSKMVVPYFSITNLLDSLNQRSVLYNNDYSGFTFRHYTRRVVYFGLNVYLF